MGWGGGVEAAHKYSWIDPDDDGPLQPRSTTRFRARISYRLARDLSRNYSDTYKYYNFFL